MYQTRCAMNYFFVLPGPRHNRAQKPKSAAPCRSSAPHRPELVAAASPPAPLLRWVSTFAEQQPAGAARPRLPGAVAAGRAGRIHRRQARLGRMCWSGLQRALFKLGGLVSSLPLAGIEEFWTRLAVAPWAQCGSRRHDRPRGLSTPHPYRATDVPIHLC